MTKRVYDYLSTTFVAVLILCHESDRPRGYESFQTKKNHLAGEEAFCVDFCISKSSLPRRAGSRLSKINFYLIVFAKIMCFLWRSPNEPNAHKYCCEVLLRSPNIFFTTNLISPILYAK
ncbi:hypothetical protein TNIN_124611 [Trichonephila inaurata madagascariensis]|uniref:Uncharacterized protein n=1 Tax=Trichonephila inaurata madagascariensis TaxID=2747483 RepID=A0A8X7C9L9_9ARAC|nr:hypothetical protein TNIN_124611 [Trichonephila inaurata madagascariensis]